MADVVLSAVATASATATNVIKTVAAVTRIGEFPILVHIVPTSVLLVGHCLAVAGHTKGRYGAAYLLSFVQGFLMAFGGSLVSNLFLGDPTGSVLFKNNRAVGTWTAAWWVVNFAPLDIVHQALDLAPVGVAARACLQVLRASLLVSQVDLAVKTFPGIVAPAIIAGALAASGGKISTDVIASISGLRAPFEVHAPTYALRSSLVGSVFYYVTVHVMCALRPTEGLAVVLLAFLAHTLTDDLLGAAYDYTVPVINVFTTVTLIGSPKRVARGRGRPAAGSAPATPRSASKARVSRGRKKSE